VQVTGWHPLWDALSPGVAPSSRCPLLTTHLSSQQVLGTVPLLSSCWGRSRQRWGSCIAFETIHSYPAIMGPAHVAAGLPFLVLTLLASSCHASLSVRSSKLLAACRTCPQSVSKSAGVLRPLMSALCIDLSPAMPLQYPAIFPTWLRRCRKSYPPAEVSQGTSCEGGSSSCRLKCCPYLFSKLNSFPLVACAG
jgi:hypothetical protein